MTLSGKNIILGICATGVAIGSAFASYTSGTRYKVKTLGGTFLQVKGMACPGYGDTRCIVKVKTYNGINTEFEKTTAFDNHGFTVFGESLLPNTLYTLGE